MVKVSLDHRSLSQVVILEMGTSSGETSDAVDKLLEHLAICFVKGRLACRLFSYVTILSWQLFDDQYINIYKLGRFKQQASKKSSTNSDHESCYKSLFVGIYRVCRSLNPPPPPPKKKNCKCRNITEGLCILYLDFLAEIRIILVAGSGRVYNYVCRY